MTRTIATKVLKSKPRHPRNLGTKGGIAKLFVKSRDILPAGDKKVQKLGNRVSSCRAEVAVVVSVGLSPPSMVFLQ